MHTCCTICKLIAITIKFVERKALTCAPVCLHIISKYTQVYYMCDLCTLCRYIKYVPRVRLTSPTSPPRRQSRVASRRTHYRPTNTTPFLRRSAGILRELYLRAAHIILRRDDIIHLSRLQLGLEHSVSVSWRFNSTRLSSLVDAFIILT